MARALTVLAAERAKPNPQKRLEIPDGGLPGLYLVVQSSGAKSWALRYRYGGKPRKLTVGAFPGIGLAAARDLAAIAIRAIAEGRDPGRERREARQKAGVDRDLFKNVAAQFIDRYARRQTRESSWLETARLLGFRPEPGATPKASAPLEATGAGIAARWSGRTVSEITRRDVIELLDETVDRGATTMANRELAAVRRMFGWCTERGIVEASPCAGVRAPVPERSRDQLLSDDEIKIFWIGADAIGWPFGPLFKLLLLTGQRRDEVGEMRWREIDNDGPLWALPRERVKAGRAHDVPLSDAALAILMALPRVSGRSGYVFTTNGVVPVSGWSRAKDRLDKAMADAGMTGEPWRLHDLRRTAASGMARLGINLPVIERVLNHVSGSFGGIVGVYQRHEFSDEKRRALDSWGAHVERLVTGQGAAVVPLRAGA